MLTEKELTLILGKDLVEAPRKQETVQRMVDDQGRGAVEVRKILHKLCGPSFTG